MCDRDGGDDRSGTVLQKRMVRGVGLGWEVRQRSGGIVKMKVGEEMVGREGKRKELNRLKGKRIRKQDI